jgi:hypothetical protein
MRTKVVSENLKGRDHSEDLVVDNIRMGIREIGWKVVDRVHVAQGRDKWLALMNTVMNLRVPYDAGNFLTA